MNYPAAVEVRTPERLERWRPLVQWILAIPHLLIAYVLQYASQLVAFVSWFIVLFTGKLPEGIANFQTMVLRYSTRTTAYAGFLHAEYPPFAFDLSNAEPGGTPVDLATVPALENRNRLTVGLRLIWAIPALLYAFVIGIVAAICWFIGFFAVLFTGKWPDGLRKWVMNGLRVQTRLAAYLALLTDEYPPFATEAMPTSGAPAGVVSTPPPPPPPPSVPPPPPPPSV